MSLQVSTVDFEPSVETKKKWLATRKNKSKREYKFGPGSERLIIHGLFDTYGRKKDSALFYLALCLELLGMFVILAGAGAGLLIIGTLLASIFIDVILAVLLHWKVGEICEFENKKTVARFRGDVKCEAFQDHINNLKSWWGAKVSRSLIWLFSISKAGYYYTIQGGNVFFILMILLYLIVAYVHVHHTGYYFSLKSLEMSVSKEKRKYYSAMLLGETSPYTVTNPRVVNLQGHVGLLETYCPKLAGATNAPFLNRQHSIHFDGNNWRLSTWGLLMDSELNTLVANQPEEYQAKLVVDAIALQLEMLVSATPIQNNTIKKVGH
jgi:hypothetical protein